MKVGKVFIYLTCFAILFCLHQCHMMLVCDLSYLLMFLEGVTHLSDLKEAKAMITLAKNTTNK